MKKTVAANTISQLVGRGISAITTLIVTLVVARQFGASGYGDFVKITTYAAFFYLIADFGVNAIFLQQDEKEKWPVLVALRLAGGAGLITVSLIILWLLPGSVNTGYTSVVKLGILLFSPTILFQGIITTANAIFQKRLRYGRATWAIFFGSMATVILLWTQTNLLMVVGVVASGIFVTAFFSFLFASRLVGRTHASVTWRQMKQLLLPSVPLGITLLFNLVYFRADSVVITLTRPTAEVGIYGLAYKVFEVILVFPTFFMNAVYPLMIRGDTKRIFKNSFLFLFFASLVTLAIVWVAAPLLVLIKSDFRESVSALRVLSFGLPFFFMTAATMWALIAKKKQGALVVVYGLSMFINILGNIFLVPTHGFMAAAWMTVVGEGIVLLLSGASLGNFL